MKLQNNFTTPEQSKKLLELGLPADSADCMNFGNAEIFQIPFQRPFSEHLELHVQEGLKKMYTPCWSVGRLMEIYLICKSKYAHSLYFIDRDDWDDNMVDSLCDLFETGVRCEYLDFSKLED